MNENSQTDEAKQGGLTISLDPRFLVWRKWVVTYKDHPIARFRNINSAKNFRNSVIVADSDAGEP